MMLPPGKMALVVTSRPHFHVGFPIIHCTKDGPIVFDPRQQESILIPIGIYRVQILVVCGDRSHIIEKLMNVHNDQVRTYWILGSVTYLLYHLSSRRKVKKAARLNTLSIASIPQSESKSLTHNVWRAYHGFARRLVMSCTDASMSPRG